LKALTLVIRKGTVEHSNRLRLLRASFATLVLSCYEALADANGWPRLSALSENAIWAILVLGAIGLAISNYTELKTLISSVGFANLISITAVAVLAFCFFGKALSTIAPHSRGQLFHGIRRRANTRLTIVR